MAKYQIGKENPDEDGFCDWMQPQMDGIYKLACCDCGLVHDMEFEVVTVVKDLGKGMIRVKPVKSDKYLVIFRARRNNRATGQMRRKR